LIVLLTLGLIGTGHSAQEDRDGRRNEQRSEDFSARPRGIEADSKSSQPLRPANSRNDSRHEWRGHNDSNSGFSGHRRGYDHDTGNRDNNRYDNGRRHESGSRGINGQELFNQRFYDDRRDNSGYYRRDNPRPVNDVIREVQQRYGGQVIGVQNSEGGSMYRVRVLQRDGRVKTVLVPAE
ncbi:MAG: hypothetical protein ABW049_06510, partial [Spongiibacteraceae bacterium]